MARNYTLEDVETLRNKSGVSYEEAVTLLDKYDGDVTRALIELEKRGQLGANEKTVGKFSFEEACKWVHNLWREGLETRIIVERKGEKMINLSVLFLILMLILGPYAMIAAAVLMLISGCSVSVQAECKESKTIFKGEEEAEDASCEAPEAAEQEMEKAADEEDKDDDFPSITIS